MSHEGAAGHLSAILSATSGRNLPAPTWTAGQTETLTGHPDGRTDDAVLPAFRTGREPIAPGSQRTEESGADSVHRLQARRERRAPG